MDTDVRTIIIFDQHAAFAGAQRVAVRLAAVLQQAGIQVVVAAPRGEWLTRSASRGVDVLGMNRRRWLSLMLGTKRPFRADLVVANGPRVFGPALLMARRHGKPCVLYLHSRPRRRWQRAVLRVLSKYATKRVLVARDLADCVSGESVVVHNCAEPGLLVSERDVRAVRVKLPTIKFLGRPDPVKGLPVLLAALEVLEHEYAQLEWRADIALGRSLHGSSHDGVGSANPSRRIRFRSGETAAWLEPGDILCVPSAYEASPLVVQEGLARQCVVVAFGVGGIPEVIRNGENGVIVENRTPEALAHSLARVVEDAEARQRLIKAGVATAERRLRSWPREIVGALGLGDSSWRV